MKEKIKEWFAEAKTIKSVEELVAFVKRLYCDTEHDYDSVVHAISAVALGGAHLGSRIHGITGFQASFVKFDWLREWDGYGKNTGCIMVMDFDNLCYPQYVKNYKGMVISLDVWKSVQKACVRKLNELDVKSMNPYISTNTACWSVREYWGDVAKGIIPPILRVVDEDEKTLIKSVAPMCVTRPTHTPADIETAYKDHTSPMYDEERFKKENFAECNGSV